MDVPKRDEACDNKGGCDGLHRSGRAVRSGSGSGFTQCSCILWGTATARTSCTGRPKLTVLMTHHIQRKSHAPILRRQFEDASAINHSASNGAGHSTVLCSSKAISPAACPLIFQ